MDGSKLSSEVKRFFAAILSTDQRLQREAIEAIYDESCHLETPYLVLQGREEIVRSYGTLATNNMELVARVTSASYDSDEQTCMADVVQTIRPKASTLCYCLRLDSPLSISRTGHPPCRV